MRRIATHGNGDGGGLLGEKSTTLSQLQRKRYVQPSWSPAKDLSPKTFVSFAREWRDKQGVKRRRQDGLDMPIQQFQKSVKRKNRAEAAEKGRQAAKNLAEAAAEDDLAKNRRAEAKKHRQKEKGQNKKWRTPTPKRPRYRSPPEKKPQPKPAASAAAPKPSTSAPAAPSSTEITDADPARALPPPPPFSTPASAPHFVTSGTRSTLHAGAASSSAAQPEPQQRTGNEVAMNIAGRSAADVVRLAHALENAARQQRRAPARSKQKPIALPEDSVDMASDLSGSPCDIVWQSGRGRCNRRSSPGMNLPPRSHQPSITTQRNEAETCGAHEKRSSHHNSRTNRGTSWKQPFPNMDSNAVEHVHEDGKQYSGQGAEERSQSPCTYSDIAARPELSPGVHEASSEAASRHNVGNSGSAEFDQREVWSSGAEEDAALDRWIQNYEPSESSAGKRHDLEKQVAAPHPPFEDEAAPMDVDLEPDDALPAAASKNGAGSIAADGARKKKSKKRKQSSATSPKNMPGEADPEEAEAQRRADAEAELQRRADEKESWRLQIAQLQEQRQEIEAEAADALAELDRVTKKRNKHAAKQINSDGLAKWTKTMKSLSDAVKAAQKISGGHRQKRKRNEDHRRFLERQLEEAAGFVSAEALLHEVVDQEDDLLGSGS